MMFNKIPKDLKIWLLLFVVTIIITLGWPGIDLAIAGHFYDAETATFPLKKANPYEFISKNIGWVIAPVVVIALLGGKTRQHRAKATVFLLLTLALGPGLVVNEVFKNHWDRARPRQVEQFGGDKQFTRALIPANQCERNCSFVSGDASVGYFVMALGFPLVRHRRFWFITGAITGLAVGYVRIVQGAHFFSDVLFCGLFVWLVARGCYWLVYKTKLTGYLPSRYGGNK